MDILRCLQGSDSCILLEMSNKKEVLAELPLLPLYDFRKILFTIIVSFTSPPYCLFFVQAPNKKRHFSMALCFFIKAVH